MMVKFAPLWLFNEQGHRTVLNHSWCPDGLAVKPYVHYQLVLETVGMPLNGFKSTRQLCKVIRDAVIGEGASHALLYKLNTLIAHTNAYNNSQILHRDVTA